MATYSSFFYGSLMSKNVLLRVLCGPDTSDDERNLKYNSIQLKPAFLKGYKRSALKGEEYPAMIYTGNEEDSVPGILCENLTTDDVKALDVFEGSDYQRTSVKVTEDNGSLTSTDAYVYIGNADLLTGTEWSFDYFLASGKEQKWLNDRCEFFDVDSLHAK
ncbi:MAG: hypothetical protein EXX96DRAFT_563501 [Benjaminiella poitrasii]|nr:MAG: hypothetical protein EXX96DRAFT_563501 [Benjaminiella poitrasii]